MNTQSLPAEQSHMQGSVSLPVLLYHAVSPVARDHNTVEAAAFAEQMAWLANTRHPLTLQEAQTALHQKQVPEGAVLVTFDDGYKDILEYAVPVLLQYHIPAVFFLLIEALGSTNYWNPRDAVLRNHLTPHEVQSLAALPGMNIGAHGFTHQRVTRFASYRIAAEMAGAQAGLQELTGQPVSAYAYPFGGFSDEAMRQAARYFSLAFSASDAGVWNWLENPFAIRRLHVAHTMALPDFIRLVEKRDLADRLARKMSILQK